MGNYGQYPNHFIKDKDNLLTFNQWSCGDYNRSFNGITISSSTYVQLSTNYSVNGDYSFKCAPVSGEYGIIKISFNFDNTKTYMITAKCKNKISGATLGVRIDDATTYSVNLPVSDSFQTVSLSFTPSTENWIVFRTYNSNQLLYIDDIELRIQ